MRRRPKADRRLERGATSAEKVIARIAPAAFHHARVCGLLRGHDCAVRDLDLGAIRAARQFLDGAAIEIARREIHLRKSASSGERVVDKAYALEQLSPIDVGDHAHTGDDVAYRHGRSALPLVFVADDCVGSGSLRRQTLVEPR